jgi:hypothetical protein
MHGIHALAPGLTRAVPYTAALTLLLLAPVAVRADSTLQSTVGSGEILMACLEPQGPVWTWLAPKTPLPAALQTLISAYPGRRSETAEFVRVDLRTPARLLQALQWGEREHRRSELHIPEVLLNTLTTEDSLHQ